MELAEDGDELKLAREENDNMKVFEYSKSEFVGQSLLDES